MKFKSKPQQPRTISAIQLVKDIGYINYYRYDEGEWVALGKKGDWLVIDGNDQYFLTDEEIKERFEEV